VRVAFATSQTLLPPSERALADAFRRHGVEVRPLIWSDAGVCWADFDRVVVRSCWDYHLRANEFVEWIDRLEQRGHVLLNTPALIR